MSKEDQIHHQVSSYYQEKLEQHGNTHLGVDWNSTESQYLRFEQLMTIHERANRGQPFSINDYGCGYGALIDYLQEKNHDFTYTGFDIADAMIQSAQEIYQGQSNIQFVSEEGDLSEANYTIASGIFNIRLEFSDDDWLAYIIETITKMWALSTSGIAFNCLTSYSDAEYMRDYLYYADPHVLFDYCKRHFSKQVALLHDYHLYEFTMLVKRED